MVGRFRMFLVAALFGLAAAPAMAGSLGQTPVDGSLARVSKCKQPTPPTLYLDDIDSYHRSLGQFNAYVARVRTYIGCVQEDGKADIDALAASVARDMQKQQNAAIKKAEDLRADMEVQRNLLR